METCDVCGVAKEDVVYTTDPFAEEINDVLIWQFMCSECYTDSAMDI